jgi:hypothetical protein
VKVKELIEELKELDPNAEARISLRKGWRPIGTKPMPKLEPAINQDTNRLGFYAIDVDITPDYPTTEEKIIMPKK